MPSRCISCQALCLIFNAAYPTGEQFTLPSQDEVERILREIRKKDGNTHEKQQSDHARICKLVAWYSRTVLPREQVERRVASEDCYNTRAYFSLGKILEYVWEDCQGNSPVTPNFEFFRGVFVCKSVRTIDFFYGSCIIKSRDKN